jgi:hypothetical protein
MSNFIIVIDSATMEASKRLAALTSNNNSLKIFDIERLVRRGKVTSDTQ